MMKTNWRNRVSGLWLAAGLSMIGIGDATAQQPTELQWNFQPAATPMAEEIQEFNILLSVIIVAITIFVLALLTYAIFRFRESQNPVPSKTTHNTLIEVVWTVVPIMILVLIAIPSFKLLYFNDVIPESEITVKAIGSQWFWDYEYVDVGDGEALPDADFSAFIACRGDPDYPGDPESCENFEARYGRAPVRLLDTDEQLVLPVDTTVRLLVTASDVIHAWTIPAFGSKIDAVPGRINQTWFHVNEVGTYYGQCSELCGVDHGFMPIAVKIVSKDEFAAWMNERLAGRDAGRPAQIADAATD